MYVANEINVNEAFDRPIFVLAGDELFDGKRWFTQNGRL
jgi:hypothetical protein